MSAGLVGSSRVTASILSRFNRLFPLTQFYTRYSGFLLLMFIAYLHFGFNALGSKPIYVFLWLILYLVYLLCLELARWKWSRQYDSSWFRALRISLNLVFITLLLMISSQSRYILGLIYVIPIFAACTYFYKPAWVSGIVLLAALTGLLLAGNLPFNQEPLNFQQFSSIALILVSATLAFRWYNNRLLTQPYDLLNITQGLRKIDDINKLVDEIVGICKQFSQAEQIMVILIDSEHNSYLTHASDGYELRQGYSIEDVAKNCLVLRTGERFKTHDIIKAFNEETIYSKYFTNCHPRSVLAEPILSRDGLILGVINVTHNKPNRFDSYVQNQLSLFSSLTSIAIENCLSNQQVVLGKAKEIKPSKRFNELDELMDEDIVLKALLEEAKRLITNSDGIVLHKFIWDTKELQPIATSEQGILKPWKSLYSDLESKDPTKVGHSAMRIGIGIAGHALQLMESIRVPDVKLHPWFMKYAQVNHFDSLMVAPLIDNDLNEPLGTISVHSRKFSAFSLQDEVLLVSLANQASEAITKAREYAVWKVHGGISKQIFDEIRKHDISAEESNLYYQIVESATRILGFTMAAIRIFRPDTNELEFIAVDGVPGEDAKRLIGRKMPLEVLQPFLCDKFRIERSFLLSEEDSDWKRVADEYFYVSPQSTEKQTGWRAYNALLTPFYSQSGKIIGLLSLDSPTTGKIPDLPTIEAIGSFTNAVAWEIELARERKLFEEQQRRRNEYLESIGDALSTLDDFYAIGEVIVHAGDKLLSAENCSLYIREGSNLTLTHSNYLPKAEIGRKKPVEESDRCGLTSWVAATGEIMIFNDKSFELHRAWAGEKEHLRYLPSGDCLSLLIVPIKNRESRVIGVLKLENKLRFGKPAYFDEDDIKRLNKLANQVALALEITGQSKVRRKWERTGLEDDLHEIINWYHSGVALGIDAINEWFVQGRYDKIEEILPKLRHAAFTTVNELKTIHSALITEYLEDSNLSRALSTMVSTRSKRASKKYADPLQIIIECPEEIALPEPVRLAFLRITSESLNNAIQHSGILDNPKISIRICVKQIENQVTLQVKDNGKGTKSFTEGYGIPKIRQLTQQLNHHFEVNGIKAVAKFNISSKPRQGTEVTVSVNL